MTQQAFVLRISPGGLDMVEEALQNDQIIIGWGVDGLLDQSHSRDSFREIISRTFYSAEPNLRKAGSAAGHMWRFIHDMKDGDLIVVPHGPEFYVAEVSGPAFFQTEKKTDGTAYRRKVDWLNSKHPIPRSIAKSALVSRMKTQGTCAWATDLLPEVMDCLKVVSSGHVPTFQDDLEARLIRETLDEIRSGRIDSYGFENLICTVLSKLGASKADVIARSKDMGADIVATFLVAGTFQQTVAVQAKHWQPEPPAGVEVVEQLITGIEAESATLGMVVTSGAISDEAVVRADAYFDEAGIKIELVDGEQFAKMIVEHGIGKPTRCSMT